MKKLFTVQLFLALSIFTFAQNKRQNFTIEDSLVYELDETKDKEDSYIILIELINLYKIEEYNKAILYCKQGELLARNNNDIDWLAQFQLEYGTIYYNLSSYVKALEKYFKATENFKKTDNALHLVKCYNNTAMVYDRIKEYHKAVDYYMQAIDQLDIIKDNFKAHRSYKAQLYNNLASAYNSLGKTEKAIQYYIVAQQEAQKHKNNQTLASIYNNLGIIELTKYNHLKAGNYFKKAISIYKDKDIPDGLSKSYNYLGDHYYFANKFDSAKWAVRKSLEISQELNLLEYQRSSHMLLYSIYEMENNYKEALNEHKIFKQLSDSIQNTQKIIKLSQLRVANEIEQIEKAGKVEKTKLKYKYSLLIVVLATSIVILLLIIRIARLQKKNLNIKYNKLEKDVEGKNRELTTNVMLLIQKNQVITAVLKDLKSLRDDKKSKSNITLDSIILNLQSHSSKEVWREFELRFNQVHSKFYEHLLKSHPDITPTEKRLCALLKLNMTSKEIAEITNQSLRSVEVARSRLRKRLGITRQDESLVKYVESF